MTFKTRTRLASLNVTTLLLASTAWAADPAPSHSQSVITDQAIRDWFSTHPEVIQSMVASALAGNGANMAFDKAVHDSLMRQPNVMQEIQQAAYQKAQSDRAAKLQEALPRLQAALFNDPADGRAGPANAGIKLVVFYDPECPYCKALQPNLTRLVQENKEVSVIYKDFPILGPISEKAAKMALAAVSQGKYVEFHDALMASTIAEHQLTEAQLYDMARAVGLDTEKLKADSASKPIMDKIAANRALAGQLGVSGTPAVLLGNQLVPGNSPYEVIEKLALASRPAARPTVVGNTTP